MRYTKFILLILTLSACFDNSNDKNVQKPNIYLDSNHLILDSSSLFKTDLIVEDQEDSLAIPGYYVDLRIKNLDQENYDVNSNNAQLVFGRRSTTGLVQLYADSIYSSLGGIRYIDFNSDGLKDILVQHVSGARANMMYHLYLVDIENQTIVKVKGFEQIPNPSYNREIDVIESYALTGVNYSSFYELTQQATIIKYDISVEDYYDDSSRIAYENALEYITQLKN